MKFSICTVILAAALLNAQPKTPKITHPDYVPDARTAQRIAEAVLIGQFGEEMVRKQSPLRAELTSGRPKIWMVQGTIRNPVEVGGNFGVWIDMHDATVKVMEHMK